MAPMMFKYEVSARTPSFSVFAAGACNESSSSAIRSHLLLQQTIHIMPLGDTSLQRISFCLQSLKSLHADACMGGTVHLIEQENRFLVRIVLRHPNLQVGMPYRSPGRCTLIVGVNLFPIPAKRQFIVQHCIVNFFGIRA